jgi:hypothetical protein
MNISLTGNYDFKLKIDPQKCIKLLIRFAALAECFRELVSAVHRI